METYQPRYMNYARLHGMSAEAMLARDTEEWPGGKMCGFTLWVTAQWRAWDELQKHGAQHVRSKADHKEFDAWLDAMPSPPPIGSYRYSCHTTGFSSDRYGVCEVCKDRVSDVFIQVEERRCDGGKDMAAFWAQHLCNTLFGHETCLAGLRRSPLYQVVEHFEEHRRKEVNR